MGVSRNPAARFAEEVVVFLGPSLEHARAQQVLTDASYRGPIVRRDVPGVVANGARVVVIIDGVFHHHSLAVSPKEIREAIAAGVHVFGAASMGALRACELEPFGMVGVGTIYEWYRSGRIVGDDEVALLFDPQTYEGLSVPLVNVRHALQSAVDQGVLGPVAAAEMLSLAASFHYADRTYPALLRRLPEEWLPACWSRDALARFLARFDLKREDAMACLNEVRTFLAEHATAWT